MEVRGVTRSRLIRELAELSTGCSSCPGDTERGSRCHLGRSSALGEGHSFCRWRRGRRWRECRRGSPGARAWREQELRLPRRASVLRKIGAQQNTSATVGSERSRSPIGYRKAAVKGRQVGCRWGCERRAPRPVSPRARPVDRVVLRSSRSRSILAMFREKVELDQFPKLTSKKKKTAANSLARSFLKLNLLIPLINC